MGDISKHFNRQEFSCKCGCGFDTIDAKTLEALEAVREHFNAPVVINSANRCPSHNASVGGATRSQHLYSRACDIVVKGVEVPVVAAYIETLGLSVGIYETFTHMDTRSGSKWLGGPAR